MSVSVSRFRLPLLAPFSTASETIRDRVGFVFQIEGNPGGIGEATPLPGFTEPIEECKSALEDAAAEYRHTGWRGAFAAVSQNGPSGVPAARHAVSLAYHDQLAKQASRPLYHHLGGEPDPDPLPVNATIGDCDVDTSIQAARDAVADGFEAVKVKVGVREVGSDVERVTAIAEALPTDVSLRVDANGAWSTMQATEFIQHLADVELEYVEEPLGPSELDATADLRRLNTPLALDESVARHGIEAILEAEAADAIVLKPMSIGGPDLTRAVAETARENDVKTVLSTTIDGVVARTAAIHVALSLTDIPPSGLATATLLGRDLAPDPTPVSDGHIGAPSTPGLGIEEVTIPDA
jgi:o-succinylbenzoate synthase